PHRRPPCRKSLYHRRTLRCELLCELCGLCVKLLFFKQKTAYELGLGIPAEPLFRSIILIKQELLLLVYELNRSGLLAENEKIRPILAQLEKLLLCDLSPSTNDSVKN